MISTFPMRRLSAITLILLAMLPVVSPLAALSSDEDTSIPACCRRHGGKRCHCAMMMAYLASQLPGTKVMATPVPCPDCPSASPVTEHFQLGLGSALAHLTEVSIHPGIQPLPEARVRITLDRAWRKRGPPTHLLFI